MYQIQLAITELQLLKTEMTNIRNVTTFSLTSVNK